MADPVDKDTGPDNALEMSDEEFMKMDPSAFEGGGDQGNVNDKDDAGGDDIDDVGDDVGSDVDAKGAADVGDDAAGTAAATAVPDKVPAADTKKDDVDDKGSNKDGDKAAGKLDEKPVAPADELNDAQYAEIGKQVMAEFKANGTTLKAKSADDAIQLMQMGANYHKKMSGLKPSLKTLKLLENHGLLDSVKLNYLIDLSLKKPEAITQLLKDSKIDPMNVDLQGENTYVPSNRTVNDTEILLDEILDTISTSPEYNRTLTVIGTDWDADSRTVIAKSPEMIQTINKHMENGIYDQVANAVAYERSLGKLVGISDFEAYQRVGTYMHENNLFKSAAGKSTPAGQQDLPAKTVPTVDADAEAERARRKAAASPSRTKPAGDGDKAKYDPLTMSDEEFIKLNKLSI
jgi:hypothetical protein